jgi:hypothetical protein
MITPKPMEIDKIQAGWEYEEAVEEEEDLDGGYVNFIGKGKGKGKCWNCGEPGHRAAECLKGKGKGKAVQMSKGGKDSGKGNYGKGSYYDSGKGYDLGKGGGKTWASPPTRACFGCGSTAHILRDCPNRMTQVQEVREEEDEDVEILFIGHTEAVEEPQKDPNLKLERVKAEAKDPNLKLERVKAEAEKDKGGKTIRKLELHKVIEAMEMSPWQRAKGRKGTKNLEKVGMPPGLSEGPSVRSANKFKVLETEAEEEEDEVQCHLCEEVLHVRKVEDAGKPKVPDDKLEKRKVWADLGVGDIVVDSAADESCWPKGHGDAFETKPSRRKISLRTANGGEMGHYGEKEVTFRSGGGDEVVGLRFQVTDVKKPLLAVRRLVERGNRVSFGPEPSENYVENIMTGRKIMMEKRGGAFIIRANFVKEMGFPRQA